MRLERLHADRGKENGVETKSVPGCARDGEMTEVGRIEAAAEECHTPPAAARHVFIVS